MSDFIDFAQPPVDALKALDERKSTIRSDIRYAGHLKAFTVSHLYKLNLVEKIKKEMQKSMEKGTSFDDFKEALLPALQKSGFLKSNKNAISTKLNLIYHTVLSSTLNQARARKQYERSGDIYLRYVGILDSKIRRTHRERNGIILPRDHEFWKTNYPPNGFRCRCEVLDYKREDLEDKGLKITREGIGKIGFDNEDKAFSYDTRGLDFDSLARDSDYILRSKDRAFKKYAKATSKSALPFDSKYALQVISNLREIVQSDTLKYKAFKKFYKEGAHVKKELRSDYKKAKRRKGKGRKKYFDTLFKLDEIDGVPLYVGAQTFGKNKDKHAEEDCLDVYLLAKKYILGERKSIKTAEDARHMIYFFAYGRFNYEMVIKKVRNNRGKKELIITTIFAPKDLQDEMAKYE